MVSERTRRIVTVFFAIVFVAMIAGETLLPKPQPVASGDAAFEHRLQKAEKEQREQERDLYCAGRPENC